MACKRYGTVDVVKQSMGNAYGRFDDIGFPPTRPSSMEQQTPYQAVGLDADYRQFQWDASWEVRDDFAGVVKEAAGKPVFTTAYGLPVEYEFWSLAKMKYLDAATTAAWYPFRLPGYAVGAKYEGSASFHNKLIIQELDLRTYASESFDAVYEQWISDALTLKDFHSIHRKMAGISLASGYGWWYYSMYRYFDDPDVMADIASTYAAVERYRKVPCLAFRPDVCVVHTENQGRFVTASQGTGRFNVGTPFQEMMLETSGVPYDLYYLNDIMEHPELQQYKVYVFMHAVYLTEAERAWIERLKNNNRTIVWVYSTGYISEKGKSTDAMSELTGMKIATEEKYERGTPIIIAGADPLVENVLPFQGMGEMLLSILRLKGSSSFTCAAAVLGSRKWRMHGVGTLSRKR